MPHCVLTELGKNLLRKMHLNLFMRDIITEICFLIDFKLLHKSHIDF